MAVGVLAPFAWLEAATPSAVGLRPSDPDVFRGGTDQIESLLAGCAEPNESFEVDAEIVKNA